MQRLEKINKRRARTSYLSAVVGISLVLLMLGIFGGVVLGGKKLSTYLKESMSVEAFMKDDLKEVDIRKFQKNLDTKAYVKSTKYVDRKTASENYAKEIGEDFISVFGDDILKDAVEIKLNAAYAHPDSLVWIQREVMKTNMVHEVSYNKALLANLNKNIRIISIVLLIVMVLLMIVAVALINNTIRLSIFAQRFVIRSMQLVGATSGFIQRPFITKGIFQGIYAALLAIILMMGFIYLISNYFADFLQFEDLSLLITIFVGMLIFGILISCFSTLLAVRKYLRIDADKLY